ncbi:putative CUE domain protein [Aspergillus homomorphus CBS 101889]|uniref:Fe2OG dioxygenase domain-containing protein n=1 Tax=Aspergillus homomorphus (strain CBS 101889) TaxID=1450537 RepID=A0A395I9Q0_ASPHC|nr:hypothetical protein BO97DRAFT_474777 [Aspergillus homomorphus CBS 101889]RAL16746.1 hypothetical protein BO97DRAFT_474777 [Aspergillus homomorphus CBS 101889]
MPSAWTDDATSPQSDSSRAADFLTTEIYNIGAQPGIRSLPPSPERDFLALTWGPVVYRTSYSALSERMLPLFLRALSTEVQAAIPRCLPGAPKQLQLLETSYACKVFSDETLYSGADINAIRRAFHDWKRADLALPMMELPARLRVCMVLDEGVFRALEEMREAREREGPVGDEEVKGAETESYASCPVVMVEENFPDRMRRDSNPAHGEYPGWTTVALSTVVEVLDGSRVRVVSPDCNSNDQLTIFRSFTRPWPGTHVLLPGLSRQVRLPFIPKHILIHSLAFVEHSLFIAWDLLIRRKLLMPRYSGLNVDLRQTLDIDAVKQQRFQLLNPLGACQGPLAAKRRHPCSVDGRDGIYTWVFDLRFVKFLLWVSLVSRELADLSGRATSSSGTGSETSDLGPFLVFLVFSILGSELEGMGFGVWVGGLRDEAIREGIKEMCHGETSNGTQDDGRMKGQSHETEALCEVIKLKRGCKVQLLLSKQLGMDSSIVMMSNKLNPQMKRSDIVLIEISQCPPIGHIESSHVAIRHIPTHGFKSEEKYFMDRFVSRKRARSPPVHACLEEDCTDMKLARLASLFPDMALDALMEILLSSGGSVETASTTIKAQASLYRIKKRAVAGAPAIQTSLSAHMRTSNPDGNSNNKKRRPLTRKGKTLHLYSPKDIAAHTPCTIIHNFLPAEQANALLLELLDESKHFSRYKFQLFDRTVQSPHSASIYVSTPEQHRQHTSEYTYGGTYRSTVRQITPHLRAVSGKVQHAVNAEIQHRIRTAYPGGRKLKYQSPREWQPNAAFVNCYDGPTEAVGYHSDELTYLGPRAVIGSLSLGVEREFRVRRIVPSDDGSGDSDTDDAAAAAVFEATSTSEDTSENLPLADKTSTTSPTSKPTIPRTSSSSSSSPPPPSKADAQGQISIHLPHNSLLVMHAEMQEEWKHAIAPAQTISPHPLAGNRRINVTYRWYRDSLHPRHTPRCHCGTHTILRCVQRKRGTRGRYMWMCYAGYAPGKKGCSFFQWAEFDDDGEPLWERKSVHDDDAPWLENFVEGRGRVQREDIVEKPGLMQRNVLQMSHVHEGPRSATLHA